MKFLADEHLYADTRACLAFLQGLGGAADTCGAAARERYHLYWHGTFSRKQAFAVKSFLATQDLDRSELWLWLDRESGYEHHRDNPFLRPYLDLLEVKRFDPELEARDTPLHDHPDLYRDVTPTLRSNLARHVVLYRYGGVYVDIDSMFLRDLGVFRNDERFAGEFCSRWSARRSYGNSAFMALRKGSETALALLHRCAETGTCRPKAVLDFDANRDLDLLVVPCVAFDPLWPHHDREDEYETAPFHRFGDFFRRFGWRFRRSSIRSHREFFPGAFTYHWHNCWDAPEHERSYFGRFDAEFDHLLEDRLGIVPSPPAGAR